MGPRNLTLPAIAALALAACQQPANDTDIAIDNQVNAVEAANSASQTVPPSAERGTPATTDNAVNAANAANGLNEADDGGSQASGTTLIPAQYRGRWGMVPADCTSTRGDAKGLITVRDTNIRFYESTAALQEQRPAIATSFSGMFVFTGEGQTWERVMTLTRTGATLKRADREGNYTYTRCV